MQPKTPKTEDFDEIWYKVGYKDLLKSGAYVNLFSKSITVAWCLFFAREISVNEQHFFLRSVVLKKIRLFTVKPLSTMVLLKKLSVVIP